jgi:DNA-directed RNA polymerase subunit RPC12/RpoP
MEEPPKTVYFAKCVSCGKLTFIDLLDDEQRCEYCREAKRTQAHAPSKKKAKGDKK